MTDGQIRKGFVNQLGMEREEMFERAEGLGFDFVEVMMDGENHRERLGEDRAEVRSLLEDHDQQLMVHLPFSVDIGSPHEHVRHGSMEELRDCIEAAASLGAEKAVMHASSRGAWDAAWSEEEIQDLIVDAVRELDNDAVDHGVEVCVENVPEGFFTIHEFERLFDETEASMTLDTGHARIDGMDSTDIRKFVEEHRDRISHVHVNDSRFEEDDHVPFGSGNLDFEEIFSPLQNGWNGTLSL
ncbi:MAG: sugar phosphate isomerase/epimerase family protein, partial [Candidatus Nanohaloarchaea archaeon]|nr:sugar phosphate isomerase/epimerase family protein [Candidatus Nanohaloarchaea archaeon]